MLNAKKGGESEVNQWEGSELKKPSFCLYTSSNSLTWKFERIYKHRYPKANDSIFTWIISIQPISLPLSSSSSLLIPARRIDLHLWWWRWRKLLVHLLLLCFPLYKLLIAYRHRAVRKAGQRRRAARVRASLDGVAFPFDRVCIQLCILIPIVLVCEGVKRAY